MATVQEEHSERPEIEREGSDTEKEPEHKPLEPDEAAASSRSAAQRELKKTNTGSLESVDISHDKIPMKKFDESNKKEQPGGTPGGGKDPGGYGATKNLKDGQQITLDELLDQIGFRYYHYVVILILSIVTVGDVMETEVGILLGPTLLCEWKLTGLEEAMSTSSLYVGALFGSLMWGTVSDKYGRKHTLILMLLWIGKFGLLTSFTNSLVPYIILRVLTGVGLGGAYLPVTYATEMVNVKKRSLATLIIFLAAFIGTILGSTLAMFTLPEENGWKWYVIVSSILVIISSFFVAAFVPESPRYLLLTGNHVGVIKVLQKFDPSLDEHTAYHLQPAEMNEGRRGAIFELCKYRSRTIQYFVIAVSWFLIKFNSMGTVLLYFERLQDKSLTNNCAERGIIIETSVMTKGDKCQAMGFDEFLKITIFNLEVGFGALIAYAAAEYLGRIHGMVLTSSVAVVFAIPLIFCMGEIVLTVVVMTSKAFSAATWYIMQLYINEYFPTYVRSIAAGSLDIFGRSAVILTPFVAQSLSKETMLGSTCVYITLMFVGLFLLMFLTYETKGKVQRDQESRNSQDFEDMQLETVPIKPKSPSPLAEK